MNLDFIVFNPDSKKPISLIDPLTGFKKAYDIEDACNYLLEYQHQVHKTSLSTHIASKIKNWWNRKWYVALDYYLCSPTQVNNFIEKSPTNNKSSPKNSIPLSNRATTDNFTPIQAILARKTYREFKDQPISWPTCSVLLRTLEGAFFPTIWQYYLVALHISELSPGVYRYYNQASCLELIQEGLFRNRLSQALCGFYSPLTAAFTIILAIDIKQAQENLPYDRALREIYIDSGRIAQKLLIKGMQQGIGGVPIAMRDNIMGDLLQIDLDSIMPIHTITMGLIPDPI